MIVCNICNKAIEDDYVQLTPLYSEESGSAYGFSNSELVPMLRRSHYHEGCLVSLLKGLPLSETSAAVPRATDDGLYVASGASGDSCGGDVDKPAPVKRMRHDYSRVDEMLAAGMSVSAISKETGIKTGLIYKRRDRLVAMGVALPGTISASESSGGEPDADAPEFHPVYIDGPLSAGESSESDDLPVVGEPAGCGLISEDADVSAQDTVLDVPGTNMDHGAMDADAADACTNDAGDAAIGDAGEDEAEDGNGGGGSDELDGLEEVLSRVSGKVDMSKVLRPKFPNTLSGKPLDVPKVFALRKAHWAASAIARDMRTTVEVVREVLANKEFIDAFGQ